jgi:hypothetical protein
MPTPTDTQVILRHLDQIVILTDRLAKVRDLVEQTDTAERIQRELTAIRQVLEHDDPVK